MDSLDGLRETVAKAICRHVYTRENTRVSDLERDAADEIIELVRQALSTPTLSGGETSSSSVAELEAERDEAREVGRFVKSELDAANSKLSAALGELETLRELVPTPLNTWGARGYQVDYERKGPGATPRWCLGLNGVGHVPIAWFYRKADAQRVVDAEARAIAAEAALAAQQPSPEGGFSASGVAEQRTVPLPVRADTQSSTGKSEP